MQTVYETPQVVSGLEGGKCYNEATIYVHTMCIYSTKIQVNIQLHTLGTVSVNIGQNAPLGNPEPSSEQAPVFPGFFGYLQLCSSLSIEHDDVRKGNLRFQVIYISFQGEYIPISQDFFKSSLLAASTGFCWVLIQLWHLSLIVLKPEKNIVNNNNRFRKNCYSRNTKKNIALKSTTP